MCTPTHQAVYTCSKTKPGTYEKTLCSFQPDQPDFFKLKFPSGVATISKSSVGHQHGSVLRLCEACARGRGGDPRGTPHHLCPPEKCTAQTQWHRLADAAGRDQQTTARDVAKALPIRLLHGGGHAAWLATHGLMEEHPVLPLMARLESRAV